PLANLAHHPSFAGSKPEPSNAAERLLQEGEAGLKSGDLESALRAFREAKNAEGSNPSIVAAAEQGEEKVSQALERDGVKLTAVPRLNCGMEKLTQLKISPQEGYMLTRVNGSYDIKSLLKMNPAPKVDTQLLFWRLKKSGHVAL
ncbi:MAG: hypothetical protein D6696_15485, partial [Acidobacteria bacterium]